MNNYEWQEAFGDPEGDPQDAPRGSHRKASYARWLSGRPLCQCGDRRLALASQCFHCLVADGMDPMDALYLHQFGAERVKK
jgi:hypothetical protein